MRKLKQPPFDPKAKYVARRVFKYGGRLYKAGDPFRVERTRHEHRKAALLYRRRKITLAPTKPAGKPRPLKSVPAPEPTPNPPPKSPHDLEAESPPFSPSEGDPQEAEGKSPSEDREETTAPDSDVGELEVVHAGGGRYRVVDEDCNPIHESTLSKEEAEAMASGKTSTEK